MLDSLIINLNISMYPFDMEKFENKIKFKIAKQQNFIEYSPQSTEYLKIINNKIKCIIMVEF